MHARRPIAAGACERHRASQLPAEIKRQSDREKRKKLGTASSASTSFNSHYCQLQGKTNKGHVIYSQALT